MKLTARGSLVWLGMILAGFALGGYVIAAWPDASTRKSMPNTDGSQPVRATASVEADPESELAGVAGAFHLGDVTVYEFGPTPLLDAVIAAPPAVDAR